MDLRPFIDEIAGQADDFLDGAANRAEARAGIAEQVNANHPELSPADRRKVVDGVMAILETEGFFAAGRGPGGAGAEDGSDDNGE
ncbi:MAG TPA: hypothetical protein VMD31_05500 [Opitutaceae bacterium]|nr:hypothetical protein [Opitutaceae bacterium]